MTACQSGFTWFQGFNWFSNFFSPKLWVVKWQLLLQTLYHHSRVPCWKEGVGRRLPHKALSFYLGTFFLIIPGNHQTYWPVSYGHLQLQGQLAKGNGISTTGLNLHDPSPRLTERSLFPKIQGSPPCVNKIGVS